MLESWSVYPVAVQPLAARSERRQSRHFGENRWRNEQILSIFVFDLQCCCLKIRLYLSYFFIIFSALNYQTNRSKKESWLSTFLRWTKTVSSTSHTLWRIQKIEKRISGTHHLLKYSASPWSSGSQWRSPWSPCRPRKSCWDSCWWKRYLLKKKSEQSLILKKKSHISFKMQCRKWARNRNEANVGWNQI